MPMFLAPLGIFHDLFICQLNLKMGYKSALSFHLLSGEEDSL